jgi:hypothetical protein
MKWQQQQQQEQQQQPSGNKSWMMWRMLYLDDATHRVRNNILTG